MRHRVSGHQLGRNEAQRSDDEKALVVLSNRLAKVKNLPVWTVCSAQQAIEGRMAGVKNIIARERLDRVHRHRLRRAQNMPGRSDQNFVGNPVTFPGYFFPFMQLPAGSFPIHGEIELPVFQHFRPDAAVNAADEMLYELSIAIG